MLRTCIGRKMFSELACVLCLGTVIVASAYLVPTLFAEEQVALSLPDGLYIIYGALALFGVISCCACYMMYTVCYGGAKKSLADAEDDDDNPV